MKESKIIAEIRRLLKDRNGLLLAHNYQNGDVQDIADITGDSLGLSIEASKTDAEVIVFCGVHFMAESAAILSPNKTVLLPRMDAGCPMADMITKDEAVKFKESYPEAELVTYVNSTADVKSVSDVCCTSANAIRVVGSVRTDTVLMAPDKNLARYTARFTDKEVTWWEGFCPTHDNLTAEKLLETKEKHPDAEVLVHPECRPEVIDIADHVASTSGMLAHVKKSDKMKFIIGTEIGLIHPLKKGNPGKEFIPASEKMICPDMKRTTLKDIYDCLNEMKGVVEVPEDIRAKAKISLDRMLQVRRDE
ncbi:MAG: quinolinate synthase NadA [Deltaproteobacteria bacterium]|uniref:Quinolinate synthase n=1 Tax=Candidatus Zymogenus saltonus TaxID=2844893 RepID=A0A9D8PQD5_9DELT|nr:quinolinate synthase NadA [Candidatus Zymogenus saltonus]